MKPIFDIQDTTKTRISFFLVLCILATISWGGMLAHPMNVVGDEPAAIQDARLILENPLNWFSDARVMVVRPPVDLFFMLGWVLWGEQDAGYQGMQTFLHLIAAYLLFCVMRKQQVTVSICMVAAILFLVNVAHYRTVQWVICVNYVLAGIFALLSVWFLLRYFETHQFRNLVGMIGMVGCGVFSHPAGVAVVLFLAYLIWQRDSKLLWGVGIVGVGIAFTGLAYVASPNHMQVQGAVNAPDMTRMIYNPIWYLGRLISSAHWLPRFATLNEAHDVEIILGIFCLLCLVWLFVRRRDGVFSHWAIWILFMVLPFVNNAADRQIVGPSRQLYLASIGSSVILAGLLYAVCQKFKQRRSQQIALVSSLVFLVWTSSIALFRAEAIDYWLVGRSYIASHQIDRGSTLLEKAYMHGADLMPVTFYTQSAILAFSIGKSVLPQLAYARSLFPEDDRLKVLESVAMLIQGDSEERLLAQANIASTLQSTQNKEGVAQDLTAALNNAAGSLHKRQDYDRAIVLYQQVLNIRPNYILALVNIGRAYFAKGERESGIHFLLRVTELEPEYWEAWQILGDMLFIIGNYENAILAYQSAYKLYGQLVDLPYNIGVCYEYLGNTDQARIWYQKVLEIDEKDPEAIAKLKELG